MTKNKDDADGKFDKRFKPVNTALLRKIEPTTLVDEWNKITVDTRDNDVKETFLKIKNEETYEKNV